MITPQPSPHRILLTMIEREVMWLKTRIEIFSGRKATIFAAGPYGRRFYSRLLNDYSIEAEFFVDNNPDFKGQTACGKPIMLKPWEDIDNFNNEYFVLISTSDTYYQQIAKQLDEVGVPYLSSDAFQAAHLLERCKTVVESLDDDFSRISYLGLFWYWLTYDDRFIQTVGDQYFAVRQFAWAYKETVCDVGAFIGDTTEEYIRKGYGKCKVIAFEPEESLHVAFEARAQRLKKEWGLGDDAIQIVPACVGKETGSVNFLEKGTASQMVGSDGGGIEVKVYAIDDFFRDKEPPTLIKADIEGAELDMLTGAAETIRRHKPKLAICVYHLAEDLVVIPEYIYQLCPEYKMAVRNHSPSYGETVLYCWI